MANKKSYAEALQGGLMGGVAGAKTGSAAGPYGALAGGVLGAGLGAWAGSQEADANAPYDELNQEEQGLSNRLLREKLKGEKRQNRDAEATQRGMGLFRNYLGAAFSAAGGPSSFSAALKPYPGLGNQGVP